MNTFVIKINRDECPNAISNPKTAQDWERGLVRINKPAPRPLNSTDRRGTPLLVQGDEVWICTDNSGNGLAAKARVGGVISISRPIEFELAGVELLENPVSLDSIPRLTSNVAIIDRLQASRRPDIYSVSEDEVSELVHYIDSKVRSVGKSGVKSRVEEKNNTLQIVKALVELDFDIVHSTQKVTQMGRNNLTIYVKNDTLKNPIVVHPYFMEWAPVLHQHYGADIQFPVQIYINSNLSDFPVHRADNRKSRSHFGFAIDIENSRLPSLVEFLESHLNMSSVDGSFRVVGTEADPLTEQERVQAARIGQGQFRADLLELWDYRCSITQVDARELLRASHIKPWADSTNFERLDPNNGLLLCAHVDALFDRGLISFENDGTMLVSRLLSQENLQRLGLSQSVVLSGLNEASFIYLSYHRDNIFIN